MIYEEKKEVKMGIKLTPKENFLKVIHKEIPQSIPQGLMGFKGYNGERCYAIVGPSILDETHLVPMTTHVDAFGLKWITNPESMSGLIPDVSNPILKDVTKWRDVIKTPDLSGIDWEIVAKKDIEKSGINDETEARMVTIGLMPFQEFVGFMGFAEGLMAMYEEPDYVKELLNWMADIYMPVIKASIDYYKPDAAYLLDDTAARYNPFFSEEMYVEFMKPVYTKLTKPYVDAGIPLEYHNCGRCEDFYKHAVEFGVVVTDPVQVENDVMNVKKTFGRNLAIAGGTSFPTLPKSFPKVDRDEIREDLHRVLDPLAKDGGFLAFGSYSAIDTDLKELNAAMAEEMYNFCQLYYEKN